MGMMRIMFTFYKVELASDGFLPKQNEDIHSSITNQTRLSEALGNILSSPQCRTDTWLRLTPAHQKRRNALRTSCFHEPDFWRRRSETLVTTYTAFPAPTGPAFTSQGSYL